MRLEITSLAKGGEGIARAPIDGHPRAILVPRSAPGDVVEADVHIEAGTPRARVLHLVHSSADRVVPPCPHAERCGGCDRMHLSLDAQRRWHQRIVRDALGAAADGVDIRYHAADRTEHWRTRVRLAARAPGGRVEVGFRAPRSHEIIRVPNCLVCTEAVDAACGEVPGWLEKSVGAGEVVIQQGSAGRAAIVLRWKG